MPVVWIVAGSAGALVLVGGAAVLALLRLPPTYFQRTAKGRPRSAGARVLGWVRNAGGILLLAVGVVMSIPVVPGPGFAVVLVGLVLIDLPGKKRLERWIVGRPKVGRALNRLRARFGKQEFVLPGSPGARA